MLIKHLIRHGRPLVELPGEHSDVDVEVLNRHASRKPALKSPGTSQSAGSSSPFGEVFDMITGSPLVRPSFMGKHKPAVPPRHDQRVEARVQPPLLVWRR